MPPRGGSARTLEEHGVYGGDGHGALPNTGACWRLSQRGPALVPLAAASAASPGPNATNSRAGVIVDLGNGTVRRVGITFSGSLSGVKALQLAGFAPSVRSFGGLGGAVCALNVS